MCCCYFDYFHILASLVTNQPLILNFLCSTCQNCGKIWHTIDEDTPKQNLPTAQQVMQRTQNAQTGFSNAQREAAGFLPPVSPTRQQQIERWCCLQQGPQVTVPVWLPLAGQITVVASCVILPNSIFICVGLGLQKKGGKNGFWPRHAFVKGQSKQKKQENSWPKVLITVTGKTNRTGKLCLALKARWAKQFLPKL